MKESFKDYFPKDFLEKPKQGFAPPIGNWLRLSLRVELLSFIDKDFLIEQDIFNESYVIKLVNDHLNSKIDNTYKVWAFYCFQKWYIKNFNL